MQRPTFALTLALAGHMAQAAIVETGPWTGKDFYDAVNKTGVANGIPYSNDAVVQHRLRSPLSKDTDMADYLSMANVARVASLLPEAQWDIVFPSANAVYTYEKFLKAVGKFPAFCNETNIAG